MYFEGCPNWRLADALLRQALAAIGAPDTAVTYMVVETPEEAQRARFRGSPTILVNGRDLFASTSDSSGLACRLYATTPDAEHAPTLEQLIGVLTDAR